MWYRIRLKAFKLAKGNKNLASQMNVFIQPNSTHEKIREAGEAFILSLYGARGYKILNKYRHIA